MLARLAPALVGGMRCDCRPRSATDARSSTHRSSHAGAGFAPCSRRSLAAHNVCRDRRAALARLAAMNGVVPNSPPGRIPAATFPLAKPKNDRAASQVQVVVLLDVEAEGMTSPSFPSTPCLRRAACRPPSRRPLPAGDEIVVGRYVARMKPRSKSYGSARRCGAVAPPARSKRALRSPDGECLQPEQLVRPYHARETRLVHAQVGEKDSLVLVRHVRDLRFHRGADGDPGAPPFCCAFPPRRAAGFP